MRNTISAYLYKYITIPRRTQSRMMSMTKFRLDLIWRGNKRLQFNWNLQFESFHRKESAINHMSVTSLRVFFSFTLVFLSSAVVLSTCVIRPRTSYAFMMILFCENYLSIYLNREKHDWRKIYFTFLSISSISGTCRSNSWT